MAAGSEPEVIPAEGRRALPAVRRASRRWPAPQAGQRSPAGGGSASRAPRASGSEDIARGSRRFPRVPALEGRAGSRRLSAARVPSSHRLRSVLCRLQPDPKPLLSAAPQERGGSSPADRYCHLVWGMAGCDLCGILGVELRVFPVKPSVPPAICHYCCSCGPIPSTYMPYTKQKLVTPKLAFFSHMSASELAQFGWDATEC